MLNTSEIAVKNTEYHEEFPKAQWRKVEAPTSKMPNYNKRTQRETGLKSINMMVKAPTKKILNNEVQVKYEFLCEEWQRRELPDQLRAYS